DRRCGIVAPMQRPSDDEYDAYFRSYVNSAPGDDVFAALEAQADETERRFAPLDDARAMHRYAEGKWSVKDILLHVTDADRIFATRVLRLARGETAEQPGFDHDRYVEHAQADGRTIADLASEFALVRRANVALYRSLPEETHKLTGVANNLRVSVRTLPWLCAGHVAHHFEVLRERYRV
ncbi:MAG: DinB family protein, partial [Planctomycetota bacterium]